MHKPGGEARVSDVHESDCCVLYTPRGDFGTRATTNSTPDLCPATRGHPTKAKDYQPYFQSVLATQYKITESYTLPSCPKLIGIWILSRASGDQPEPIPASEQLRTPLPIGSCALGHQREPSTAHKRLQTLFPLRSRAS